MKAGEARSGVLLKAERGTWEDGMALAYDALAATPVSTDPFAHVVVPGFVPRR